MSALDVRFYVFESMASSGYFQVNFRTAEKKETALYFYWLFREKN